MATSSTSPAFTVRRLVVELLAPAMPTPHEQKPLSDIDDQYNLRIQIPFIQIYRCNPSMKGKEPAKVIRKALAQALVFYYPLAGRLREVANGNIVVDCTGEGVFFIEAEADFTIEQLGGDDALQPPFPCIDELLYDIPGSGEILNCPLVLTQVTKLKCGSFVVAHRFNHVVVDGSGIHQFISAVAEIARGFVTPSILPVWERHHLYAPNPPRVTFKHHEYDQVVLNTSSPLECKLVQRSFFFGSNEFSLLRRLLPSHLRSCTTKFELLAACLWRCRTVALNIPDQTEEVRIVIPINMRSKFRSPLPSGYYGNAVVGPAAITTVEKLCKNPLGYSVELVKQAKASATVEYVKSTASLMVINGKRHPYARVGWTYALSDITKFGFLDMDYGWGKAEFGGPPELGFGVASFSVSAKDKKGEFGTLVGICLPPLAMEIFAKELDNIFKGLPTGCKREGKSIFISSPM